MDQTWDDRLKIRLANDEITGYALVSHQGNHFSEPTGHMSLPEAPQVVRQMTQYLSDSRSGRKYSPAGLRLCGQLLQVFRSENDSVWAVSARRRSGLMCYNLSGGLLFVSFDKASHHRFSELSNECTELQSCNI